MARASTSLFLFIVCCSLCFAQAFGRFGYSNKLAIPGFKLEADGFTANYPSSDKFQFVSPTTEWTPTATTDLEQTVKLGQGDKAPWRVRVNLLAPGFMLYFPKGIFLRVRSTAAPYLTWPEASVGEKVPTPMRHWVGISFKDNQPPIVLGFLDGAASLQVEGRPADWIIRSQGEIYSGWVRVVLPYGLTPFPTNSAATLGQFSTTLNDLSNLWPSPTPKLQETVIASTVDGLQATWRFDHPGAAVPAAALLAAAGGYRLEMQSPYTQLPGETEAGPIAICDSDQLTIHFPTRRIPLGRSLTVGPYRGAMMATASPFDVGTVVELAFENLLGSRPVATRALGEQTASTFIQETPFSAEPFTKQQLPYDAAGHAIDLAAAHGLLSQAFTTSSKATSVDNTMLTSVSWRRDWYTWQVWMDDRATGRRAAAIAAVACALCPEPQRRLEGAMLEAGLAAERALVSKTSGSPQPLMEALPSIRQALYGTAPSPDSFEASLLAQPRVFGDTSARLEADGKAYKLIWTAASTDPSSIILGAGYPLALANANLASVDLAPALGFVTIRYRAREAGDAILSFTPPSWVTKPVRTTSIPAYEEVVK